MTRLPENNSIISHYFPKELGKLKGLCGRGGGGAVKHASEPHPVYISWAERVTELGVLERSLEDLGNGEEEEISKT